MKTFAIILSLLPSLFVNKTEPGKLYIEKYRDIAVSEMKKSGIPASIKLAQGLLESDWGRSELATVANNHFGIKCNNDWTGEEYYKQDDDYSADGTLAHSCFRKFPSAEFSYEAHSLFLSDPKKQKRYGFLFALGKDYKAWAAGLKDAGYATDPAYPTKLISVIEKYELYKYDEGMIANNSKILASSSIEVSSIEIVKEDDGVLLNSEKSKRIKKTEIKTKSENSSPRRVKMDIVVFNDLRAVRLNEDLDLVSLSRSVGINIKDLITYNEVYKYQQDTAKQDHIVYLERKPRDYTGTQEFHKVKAGETIEMISQQYGVRASTLYTLNHLKKDYNPEVGERISLSKKIDRCKNPKSERKRKIREKEYLFQ